MSSSDATGRGRSAEAPAPVERVQRARPSPRRPRTAAAMADIPKAELTPTVRSTVTRLMSELDRLKDELMAARERVQELENAVDEDPLVPVLNRRGFIRELARVLAHLARYGGRASLLYIDLDGFKAVNDRHGHAAGDAVLRRVGALLAENVRKSDIVGRIGGDEFAVVLHHAGGAAGQAKAERLAQMAAAAAVEHGGRRIAIAFSAGVTELAPGDSPQGALDRADRAMYACKQQRRRDASAPAALRR